MSARPSRRQLLAVGAFTGLLRGRATLAEPSTVETDTAPTRTVPVDFPTQPAELAREFVGVCHSNIGRVRELLEQRHSLACAAWDWGFGDWETALGAASHTGQREIALLLLEHGARPTLFSAAMLGQLEVVKAFVAASPGVQRTPGPHGIPLLSHAEAGGEPAEPVARFLTELGDAGRRPPTVELPPGEADAVTGVYAFGPYADERITVAMTPRGLTFKRDGTSARNLFHVGERAFFPAGTPAVRIRFSPESPRATELAVYDPGLVLTARRIES